MLTITDRISIDESDLDERFIRATGPGGQNVNKVASAVQLRFAALASPSLSDGLKERLARVAGRRLGQDGVITITARRFRTQELNRRDARERLVALLREAAEVPVTRRATRPSRASKERRLEAKSHRAAVKRLRGRVLD